MSYKIGIYGSAIDAADDTVRKAEELGTELARHDISLITGAGHGIPYLVAASAVKSNPSHGGKCQLLALVGQK